MFSVRRSSPLRESTLRTRSNELPSTKALDKVLQDVVIDLNAELAQVGEDFDYRGKLRDEDWVKGLAHRILADYTKLVSRGRIDSFEEDFRKASKERKTRIVIRKSKKR